MRDAIRLVLLGTAVGSGSVAVAVGVERHGGLGGIGIKNTIVIVVVRLMGVQRGYIGLVLGST